MGMRIDFVNDLNIRSSGTTRDPAFLRRVEWTCANGRWRCAPYVFKEGGMNLIEKAGDEQGEITKSN